MYWASAQGVALPEATLNQKALLIELRRLISGEVQCFWKWLGFTAADKERCAVTSKMFLSAKFTSHQRSQHNPIIVKSGRITAPTWFDGRALLLCGSDSGADFWQIENSSRRVGRKGRAGAGSDMEVVVRPKSFQPSIGSRRMKAQIVLNDCPAFENDRLSLIWGRETCCLEGALFNLSIWLS